MLKWFIVVPSLATLGCAMLVTGGSTPAPKPKTDTIAEVNYAEHIAPLLNEHCVPCHRPNEVAPFSLIGYQNAKKWAKMASFATETGSMPPWKAQPSDVEYWDDLHLSKEEKKLLKEWADAGAPQGDKSKEPPTPKFNEGWRLGEPDLIWKMPYEMTLSAEGEDEYWNYVIKNTSKEPLYVAAIDVKPGNREIVHHVIAFLDSGDRGTKLAQGKNGDGKLGYRTKGGGIGFNPSGSVGGWAPGANPRPLPEDASFVIEPGTDIILQIHYNKSGKVEKDQTEVAVYLHEEKPKKEVDIAWIANPFIRIKPNESNQKFQQNFTLPADVRVYSVMPHMHLLGKSMKAVATLPDGKEMTLIDVQGWDFNWQYVYSLKKPLDLPKGTKMHIEAVFDNSTDNPFQPHDPPKMVTWGEETTDEMMLLVVAMARL